MKLSDIRMKMQSVFRDLSAVTGNADVDLTKEQHHSRIIPTMKDKAKNELVLVCWGAVSAASSADELTPNDFDASLLLTGHAELEVTGAIIMSMCERLLRMSVEAGVFSDVREPLAMLASNIIPDMSDDDDRCGHA